MHKMCVFGSRSVTLDNSLWMVQTDTHVIMSSSRASTLCAPRVRVHWSVRNLPNWNWNDEEEGSRVKGNTGEKRKTANIKRQFDLLLLYWWRHDGTDKLTTKRRDVGRGGRDWQQWKHERKEVWLHFWNRRWAQCSLEFRAPVVWMRRKQRSIPIRSISRDLNKPVIFTIFTWKLHEWNKDIRRATIITKYNTNHQSCLPSRHFTGLDSTYEQNRN